MQHPEQHPEQTTEQTPEAIAREIVAREGGYVDDPDDPGGPTKWGVTIHTMRTLMLDLDGDGDVDGEDVRCLTQEMAVDIFLRHYFRAPRIDWLPQALHASVFDMQVNAGSNAIKILQRLLRLCGQDVSVDGAIGPQTARAADALAAQGAPLADAYGIARRDYYFRLAERRAQFRKYVRRRDGGKGGWIRRAEDFIAPRFHLSQRQFETRIATWT
ncbi:holin-associated N-acetylmuramidase [Ruegeria sp.]|uniref:holin-associated N-acetylmuramidase n=1 Tax=Ruegeria sp. TaxID=1879320 RepID=UPI003B00DF47